MLEENINLIRKIVWSYVRGNPGLEFDDLFSEACLAYIEAAPSYDPEKGKQSTFIWHVVKNHLNNFLSRWQKELPVDCEVMETLLEDQEGENPEQVVMMQETWEELFTSLSPEAQAVCSIINSGNVYFTVEKPRESRGIIAKELRRQGWSHSMVWSTFRELKEALRS